jgi:hypothetical protein
MLPEASCSAPNYCFLWGAVTDSRETVGKNLFIPRGSGSESYLFV